MTNVLAFNVRQLADTLVGIEVRVEGDRIFIDVKSVPAAEGVGYLEAPRTFSFGISDVKNLESLKADAKRPL